LFDQTGQAEPRRIALGHCVELNHIFGHQRSEDIKAGARVDIELPGYIHGARRSASLAKEAEYANGIDHRLDSYQGRLHHLSVTIACHFSIHFLNSLLQ
jgi:hypothetical protein